jgi:putative SOS response-associated peptidase YedK
MCSRYCLTSSPGAVRQLLATTNDEQFPPRGHISPTQPVHVARLDPRGQRRLDLVRWGLIPSWVKDFSDFSVLFSARGEGALEKPTFRAGLRYRRCLVPADGYFQWTGPKGARQAHVVGPTGPGPIAFAGIWDHWLGADGSELESMAILTVAAGPDVAGLHDRMPAILAPGTFAAWLDCRGCPAADAAGFLRPAPPGLLRTAPLDRGRVVGPAGDDETPEPRPDLPGEPPQT